MEREFINSTGASKSIPRGYSHVATVRNPGASVFLAGQGPVDENLKLVGGGDIEAQIRATFHDIKRNLEAARASFGDSQNGDLRLRHRQSAMAGAQRSRPVH